MKPAFEILVPVWNARIHVFIGNMEETEKWFNDTYDDDVSLRGPNASYLVYRNKETGLQNNYLWLKDAAYNWKPPERIGVLCHECVHLANSILHNKGVVLDGRNDEAEAYLAGFIMENLIKHLTVKRTRK